MKNILITARILILTLILAGCAVRQNETAATKLLPDDRLAGDILVEFLENLHAGEYADAAQHYGGTYETMTDHNPGVDPDDHAALLQNACTLNGMQCLRVKSIKPDKEIAGADIVFRVEFLKDDGTPFVLEACCGADDKEFPPQSMFTFAVRRDARGEFVVMDTPPYAP